ncbi:hypothetical protein [Phenylobacterium sp.]|jgi:hypothetical protein|uniref:hypothetical protein n=1 Tax=Phenylobacterium sp. TaxID=1871053 RepID=UPI002F3F7E11
MLRTLKAAAVATAVAAAGALPLPACAQMAERVYDQGPVWQISSIETRPGMFDDYMAYLATTWRKSNELQKKRGDVLDYRVLAVDAPRDHEPDVILIIQYKNMAAFDRSLDDQDKDNALLFGSTPKSNQAAVSRESMRVLRGVMNTREIKFK